MQCNVRREGNSILMSVLHIELRTKSLCGSGGCLHALSTIGYSLDLKLLNVWFKQLSCAL